MYNIGTAVFDWRRGAFCLWVITSVLWCGAVFRKELLEYKNAGWFPGPRMVHIQFSATENWDYPAEWGVQRIRADIQKRLAAKDEKMHEWAAHVPASVKDKCNAIPPTTPFEDQPADCVELVFATKGLHVVPSGWESQIVTAPVCKNGSSSCEPWQRDWGEDGPKPGFVVTKEGVIVPLSWWGVIAAGAPWAIVPPFAVLAAGASLFWALKGYRLG